MLNGGSVGQEGNTCSIDMDTHSSCYYEGVLPAGNLYTTESSGQGDDQSVKCLTQFFIDGLSIITQRAGHLRLSIRLFL